MAARSRNIDEVVSAGRRAATSRKTADWIKTFDTLEIPAGPVKTLDEVIDDRISTHRFLQQHMQHPDRRRSVMPEPPGAVCRHAAAIDRLPPAIGRATAAKSCRRSACGQTRSTALAAGGGVVLPDANEKVA
jgi:crotonobetainyl-CoA:carnitine CoA-transferase CaiB-like acyl-CoA transferase